MQPIDRQPQPSNHTDQPPAWVLDLLLGVAVALVIALVISADQGGRQPADALAYVIAACFGGLMLLRRWPVFVLWLTMLLLFGYYILGYPAIGLAVPVAAALYSAADRGRMQDAIVVSLILVSVSTYFRLQDGESVAYLLGYELVSTVTLLAAAIALGDSTRVRRELRAEQAQTARLIEQEHAMRAEQQIQAERAQIARDLHDLIGHSMSVISLHADVAREALGQNEQAVRQALGHIRATSSDTMRELRTTVKLLRTPSYESFSQRSLGNLPKLTDHAAAHGLQIDLHTSGNLTCLPVTVDSAAYRIVQEALTNVIRHAQATHVCIRLSLTDKQLQVEITNNGPQSVRPFHPGNGIVGMHERARLLGGTLRAEPQPSGGFVVQATLPLKEHQ
jgi:signal transduction histidine kinase